MNFYWFLIIIIVLGKNYWKLPNRNAATEIFTINFENPLFATQNINQLKSVISVYCIPSSFLSKCKVKSFRYIAHSPNILIENVEEKNINQTKISYCSNFPCLTKVYTKYKKKTVCEKKTQKYPKLCTAITQ